jgi:hypothetical protein
MLLMIDTWVLSDYVPKIFMMLSMNNDARGGR